MKTICVDDKLYELLETEADRHAQNVDEFVATLVADWNTKHPRNSAAELGLVAREDAGAYAKNSKLDPSWGSVDRIMQLDWSKCGAAESIPGKVSGAWTFRGSRLPLRALFENMQGGATKGEFLEWFDGADSEQIDEVLEFVARQSSAA